MKLGPGFGFAVQASILAAAAGTVVTSLALLTSPQSALWALAGWAPAALTGVAGGAWLAETHGRADRSFFFALGAGMLARLTAVLGSLALALGGGPAVWKPCLAGLAAGYVPLQVFEVSWFLRGRARAAAGRSGRIAG